MGREEGYQPESIREYTVMSRFPGVHTDLCFTWNQHGLHLGPDPLLEGGARGLGILDAAELVGGIREAEGETAGELALGHATGKTGGAEVSAGADHVSSP